MYDLSRTDLKTILDLVTSLVHVKSISAFSEMLINSKEQLGYDSVTMTELIFHKTVTHRVIFSDNAILEGVDEFTPTADEYKKNKLYTQIFSGREVLKIYSSNKAANDIFWFIEDRSEDEPAGIYCRHILAKMNKETMTANVIIFEVTSPDMSAKFDSMAAYLHIHLMSAYVRIMGVREVLSEKLSERELSVITWLKHGKTSWEVAKILDITENTVNFHIKNIKRKLNATNRQHAVAIAIAKGAIE